ncbi:MAG: response regulator [Bdellovibrionales bacterium]|nr:response regulator [Bdellovibrionales bacterium]
MSVLSNSKILIIDDNPDIIDYLSMVIEDNIAANVFEALDGKSGMSIIEKYPVDLVISDLNMPEMNGFQIAETINKNYPNILCMLITGNVDMEAYREAMKYKVYDFVEKPFNDENLLIRIKNALETISERKVTQMLAREAIIQVYGFESPDDFDELSSDEQQSLRTRVIAMISQSYERGK